MKSRKLLIIFIAATIALGGVGWWIYRPSTSGPPIPVIPSETTPTITEPTTTENATLPETEPEITNTTDITPETTEEEIANMTAMTVPELWAIVFDYRATIGPTNNHEALKLNGTTIRLKGFARYSQLYDQEGNRAVVMLIGNNETKNPKDFVCYFTTPYTKEFSEKLDETVQQGKGWIVIQGEFYIGQPDPNPFYRINANVAISGYFKNCQLVP